MTSLSTDWRFIFLCGLAAIFSLGCDAPSATNHAPNAQKLTISEPKNQSETATAQTDEILSALADHKTAERALLKYIHQARNLGLGQAIPSLRRLLTHAHPAVVVAAAAALQGLKAPKADLEVIEAAGRLSRAHRYEFLRQILFIIGSIGGQRAQTYLQTVAQAHPIGPIRKTATSILERMNSR